MPNMDPQQALEFINYARLKKVELNYDGHVQLQEAVRVLDDFITTNQKPAKEK